MNQDRHSSNTRRMSGLSAAGKRSTSSSSSAKASNDSEASIESHVNVAVRCRPMSEKEIADGHQSIVEFEDNNKIVVHDTSATPSDQLGTKSGERHNYSHVYDFNAVFDCSSTQAEIYDRVCRPIVDSVLEGYNGTIFAYGQTGTGKTYTIEGLTRRRPRSKQQQSVQQPSSRKSSSANSDATNGNSGGGNKRASMAAIDQASREDSCSSAAVAAAAATDDDQDSEGIIPRAFKHIFDHVARNTEVQFLIRASYLEIYQEEVHDLLRKDRSIKLELHERPDVGVYVKDLTSFVCKSITEIERVMRVGNQNRMVGATDMNEHSSRSHAIFMITVEQQQRLSSVSSQSTVADGGTSNSTAATARTLNNQERVIRVGKLNLVDLAGSERQRKTNSFGQRQRESIKINLSLSALGNVINSLMKINTTQQQQQQSNKNNSNNTAVATASTASHTPYRDSKLTRLLQDSLGGNAKTLMIANIGPASYNYDETINTLNYASRAKCIRNRPRLNEDPKDALLRELQREIDELRSKLAAMSQQSGGDDKTSGAAGQQQQLGAASRRRRKGTHKTDKNGSLVPMSMGEENDDYADADAKRIEAEFLELKQKLSSLESKLLNGEDKRHAGAGGSAAALDQRLLQGYTYEQELALEKSRAELADQAGREKAIRDELERREEAEMLAKESFSSIQQELDAKKRLIRQILLKIKCMRDELEGTQKAYRLELDELDQLQYNLQKELKLKCLIMDNFVPNSHVDQLLPRIVYNEKRNCCSVEPIQLALDHCVLNDQEINLSDYWRPSNGAIRARSEFEKIGETIYPGDIRYKCENLIQPIVDRPKYEKRQLGLSTTDDGAGGDGNNQDRDESSSRVQHLIDSALSQREPDIVI